MKLSFITDEITQDFDEAVLFARQYGMQGLELRSVEDTPIDSIPQNRLTEWKKQLDDKGLAVSNLASSFYKCGHTDKAVLTEEMEKLKRLLDAADILGCGTIRGFAFWRQEGLCAAPEELAGLFEAPAKLLRVRRNRLLLEADPSVNTTNHKALAKLLKLLDAELFGAIYDPGNDIYDPQKESPYPEGYEAIAPHMAHVHIKDAVFRQGQPECVKIGTGLVDYPGLLSRLIRDGYDGWLSLETHYRRAAVLTEEQMRLPQGAAFSAGGKEAMAESADALKELLRQAAGRTL